MFEFRYGSAGAGRGIVPWTVAVLVLAWAMTAAAPARAADCANAMVVPTNALMLKASSDAILCLINVERTRRALAPVADSPMLDRAASSHSEDMVRRHYFDHVSPSGVDLRKRVARTGYMRGARRATLGETLAFGSDYYASPVELVKDLMASRIHRAIITNGRFRDVGVGLALGAPLEELGASGSTLSLNFGRR